MDVPRPRAPTNRRRARMRLASGLFALAGANAAWGAPDACDAPPQQLARAVQDLAPSVVRVVSVRWRGLRGHPDGDAGRGAADPEDAPAWVADAAVASGFAIEDGAVVVTSAHAVAGAAETWVDGPSGRELAARVLGSDERLDVAVLRVEGERFTPVRWSPVPAMVGQWVGALGAPFGFERSVTAGIVSAPVRELPGGDAVPLIQTDVALNPGSSGGPLFDLCGAVVGMNSLVFSAQGTYLGVSFSVPADRVAYVAAAILREGLVRSPGAHAQSLTPALQRALRVPRAGGAVVTDVDPGSAAAAAGLRAGDVVLAVDGAQVGDADTLLRALSSVEAPVRMQVWRAGAPHHLTVSRAVPDPPAGRPPRGPGWSPQRLGLQLAPHVAVADRGPGLRVLGVSGDGLLAGVEEGDRILAVNDVDVADVAAFEAAVRAARSRGAGELALLLDREGVPFYVAVPLRHLP